MKGLPKSFRRWVLAKPVCDFELTRNHFQLEEVPLPDLKEGCALVKVKLINLHSGTRARMESNRPSRISGMTRVGDTDSANYACAEVVASRDPAFTEGDLIACQTGWQEYQIISSKDTPIGGYEPANEFVRAINQTNAPMTYVIRPEMARTWGPDVLMNIFGTSGLTAYFGLRECGPIMPRDCMLVAGAGGAVGNIAAQLAKAAGAYVVGLAGGLDRCRWVTRALKIDSCLDYRAPDLPHQLRAAFPTGIDVFSDGVGGSLTEDVVRIMNENGRLFSYGLSAALYSTSLGADPNDFATQRQRYGLTERAAQLTRKKDIKVACFIVYDYYGERIRAENDLSRLLTSGAIKSVSNVTYGFELVPDAIVDLFAKPHAGKAQVDFVSASANAPPKS